MRIAATCEGAMIVDSSDFRIARLDRVAASSSPPCSYAAGNGAKYTPGSSGS